MLCLPDALLHAIIAATVRCTPPHIANFWAPAAPGPKVYGCAPVPNSKMTNLLLQKLPAELHSAIVSACCIQPEGGYALRLHLAQPTTCSNASAGSAAGQELYLPLEHLTHAHVDVIAAQSKSQHSPDCSAMPQITSCSLPMFDGTERAVPSPGQKQTAASGGCTLTSALPVLAPLTALTRLMVQGAPVQPQVNGAGLSQSSLLPPLCGQRFEWEHLFKTHADHPESAASAMANDSVQRAGSCDAGACTATGVSAADENSAPGNGTTQLHLPNLQHLEVYGCNSSDAALMVNAADPANVRLLALVGLQYSCTRPLLAPRVREYADLRALNFALSHGKTRLQVRYCGKHSTLRLQDVDANPCDAWYTSLQCH